MANSHRRLLSFTVLLIFVFVTAYAQETTGTISGTVKDESGALIPGVTVTAVSRETGATRNVVTDDEGRFRLPQLAPGAYELRAELSGFQTTMVQGISLSIGQAAVVPIVLKVGEIAEQMIVSGESPLVETTTATVGSLVDTKTIQDLPLNGRDFVQLAALQEGVVTPTSANRARTGDQGVKMSVDGTRPNQTAVLLDGTDIKNFYGGTPGGVAGALLGVDTVREFRVITHAYSAEYGRFTGGVISAVTRSGTNELHGTIFEFHRNSALDARNFFDPNKNPPPFKRNQFGFTLGGPVRKDRTFFFGSYEGLRDRLTTSFVSIFPNADARKGILPGRAPIRVPPNVQPYLDLYPLPNGRDNGDGTGQFIFDNPVPIDEDYFVVKIDHRLSESDSFFVRYTVDFSEKSALNEGYIYGLFSSSRNQYVTAEEKHIFSPSVLNEFRAAYNRSTGSDDDFEHIAVPQSLWFRPDRRAMGVLAVSGGISQIGTTTRTPQFHTQNLFQYMDNLVWTRGGHAIKMGASISRFQYNYQSLARLNGSYSFRNLSDFLQGRPNGATLWWGDPFVAGLREYLMGFYFQDDFQVRPNLTFNVGLRYEFITSPTEVAGRIGNLSNPFQREPNVGNPYFPNPSLKNFSPRVGFAWDPTGSGKTSIRGGFGLFHDQLLPWLFQPGVFRMAPFAVQAALETPRDSFTIPTGIRELTASHQGVTQPDVDVLVDPNQPYVMQWSFSLQRELPGGMAASATYSGSRGVHLNRTSGVNQPFGALVNGRRYFPPDSPLSQRHNPAYLGIGTRLWDANSWYNGLKLGLRKRFSSGFQYQVSYHWQKFMDESSNTSGSPGDFRTSNVGSLHWLDPTLDRGLSAYHTGHSFSSNWTVDLPFGPGKRYGGSLTGFGAKLLEGWQINGIVQLASGPPVNIEGDGLRTCEICGSRPNLKAGFSNNPQTGDIYRWFDINAFEMQEAGFFGNLGRNTGVAPGLATLDLSLLKSFHVTEPIHLQFRAEFFNVLNRANFGAPARTRTAFARGQPSGSFGQILDTATTARQIQFALKILF